MKSFTPGARSYYASLSRHRFRVALVVGMLALAALPWGVTLWLSASALWPLPLVVTGLLLHVAWREMRASIRFRQISRSR